MGVVTYKTSNQTPLQMKEILPDTKELGKLLKWFFENVSANKTTTTFFCQITILLKVAVVDSSRY